MKISVFSFFLFCSLVTLIRCARWQAMILYEFSFLPKRGLEVFHCCLCNCFCWHFLKPDKKKRSFLRSWKSTFIKNLLSIVVSFDVVFLFLTDKALFETELQYIACYPSAAQSTAAAAATASTPMTVVAYRPMSALPSSWHRKCLSTSRRTTKKSTCGRSACWCVSKRTRVLLSI